MPEGTVSVEGMSLFAGTGGPGFGGTEDRQLVPRCTPLQVWRSTRMAMYTFRPITASGKWTAARGS